MDISNISLDDDCSQKNSVEEVDEIENEKFSKNTKLDEINKELVGISHTSDKQKTKQSTEKSTPILNRYKKH